MPSREPWPVQRPTGIPEDALHQGAPPQPTVRSERIVVRVLTIVLLALFWLCLRAVVLAGFAPDPGSFVLFLGALLATGVVRMGARMIARRIVGSRPRSPSDEPKAETRVLVWPGDVVRVASVGPDEPIVRQAVNDR